MVHIMGAPLFGPLQQPGSSWPRSSAIIEAAGYPVQVARSRFHLGIPLAVLVVWFINKKTTSGYQSKAVGVNARAATFGGVNTTRVILWTALISGGLAGLAGVGELRAIQHRLIMDISPGYDYSGIVIAMLGNLHPIGVMFSSLFFSVIIVGAQTMSRMTGVPTYITELEGIELWGELKTGLTVENIKSRALELCHRAIARGTLAIRSHVDISDERLLAVEALLAVREEIKPYIDLQLVAFPQDGYFRCPGSAANLERALDLGVDVVGGIPHFERTMADGSASIAALCELAAERGLGVDMHCDESDDPLSRHTEMLTFQTRRLGLRDR